MRASQLSERTDSRYDPRVRTSGFIGLIAAVSPSRVLGIDGQMPWHYPADLRHFRRTTLGSTVVMGRRTFESLGERPLDGRENFVVTLREYENVRTFGTVRAALDAACTKVWVIGGERVFVDALPFADRIELTFVPDDPHGEDVARFPELDPREWIGSSRTPLPGDARLEHQTFVRRHLK